jgi:hypothetical protein
MSPDELLREQELAFQAWYYMNEWSKKGHIHSNLARFIYEAGWEARENLMDNEGKK